MRYHLFVFATALVLAVSVSANRAQADALTSDDHPATVPADVQLEPILSDQFSAPVAPPAAYLPPQLQYYPGQQPTMTPVAPSYFPPSQPGAYPNMPASWAEYGAAAPPAVPISQPCEATSCNDDAPWTHWYFEADLVGFTRGNDSRDQRITSSLDTTDLDFGMVAGPYLVLGTFVDPHNQWQLVYFIASNMSAEAHQPAFGISTTYDSTFQSAELNYLHTWTHWSFLAGFRYLHLDEHFHLSETFADRFFDFRTANDLYGGQIGLTYHHEWSWILVDWAAKFGIYGNSVVDHGKITDGGLIRSGKITPSATSGSFENDIFLGHRFSPHWMGRIGLITLTASNVALAPDLNRTTDPDGTVTIVGLTIGALAQW